jgi:restriction endonuclease Mrr
MSDAKPHQNPKRANRTSAHSRHSGHDALQERLQEELLTCIRRLSFPAYCHLVRLLLYRSGYTSVQVIEPSQLGDGNPAADTSPARLLYSGLLAVSHTDMASALTLVRVKQAKGAPVSRRFVDQLRGAMLRLGAEQGLLIATGRFSRYAAQSATQPPLPPVRLIDGALLCRLLAERRLGVQAVGPSRERASEGEGGSELNDIAFWQADPAFFAALERRARQARAESGEPARRRRNTLRRNTLQR